MTKTNYFLTNSSLHNSRWLTAFPAAQLINVESDPLPLLTQSLVWVYTGVNEWETLIQHYAAQNSVVVLTLSKQIDELRSALNVGARGYADALSSIDTLQRIGNSIEQGAMWLPPLLIAQMIGSLSTLVITDKTSSAVLDCLTPRERDVTDAILQGATNKEIARQLAITERTVKAHLTSIFQKTGVRDRMQLLLVAGKQ